MKTEDRQTAPSLSLWLNADFFKRIFPRLVNLPAASAAEQDGANVMRVDALPVDEPSESSTVPMKDALSPLCTP